jgi:hypothetical protein
VYPPRAAARKKQGQGGSDLASPILPFLAGGDLQQEKRKRRQLILIHFCPDCCIFFPF